MTRSAAHRLWLALSLVFALALGLRLAHLLALRASFAGSDLFSLPIGDAEHHWKEALAILGGDAPLRHAVPWKGPGYSYFLAALVSIFGPSVGAVRWPLAVLGSVNCALLVLLARRTLALRFSVVAGVLAALNGLLIVYDSEPFQPTLLITLNLGALWLLSRDSARRIERVAAGVLLGLTCLVHPAYLLPSALLVLWSFRRGLRQAALLALALAATIAPVTLNNLIAHGEPVLISWNGGINVYAGNHPTFDQRSGNVTQAWGRLLNVPRLAGIESVAERDRLYYRLALRRALHYPLATAGVLLDKAIVFFSPVEYSNNFPIYDLRERSPVVAALLGTWGPLGVPFGLWAPAALIGLVLLLRRRDRATEVVAVWALGVMATNVLVFNTARYRAPVVFFGCIWVAAALAAAWDLVRARRWRRLLAGSAAYVALAVLLAWNAVPQPEQPPPLEWYQARALTQTGRFADAAAWAERAVARNPRSAQLLIAVSELCGQWTQRELQREYLRRALALPDLEPDTIDTAHEQMAASLFAQGRFDESRDELFDALAVGVDDSTWHGYPHYPLGLGPIRSCTLRLRLADVEIRRGASGSARELLASVRDDCPPSAPLEREREQLEQRLGP